MKKNILILFCCALSISAYAQTFTLYKPDPSNSSENDLRGVCFDQSSGKIWVVSYSELKRFDGTSWTNYPNLSISTNSYSYGQTMKAAANGNIWIAAFGQGIVVFNGTTFDQLNTSNSGIPNNYVNCLDMNLSGKTYVGVGNGFGFASVDGTTWNSNWPSPGISGSINDVAVDNTNNNVWVAGTDLYKLNGNTLTVYEYANLPVPYTTINCLKTDANSNLWLGTEEGLWKYDGANWTTYISTNSGLPGDKVTGIAINNGTLWLSIGGGQQSLVKFDQTNWEVFNMQNSQIQSANIRKMTFDDNSNLWLATDVGLIKVNTTVSGISSIDKNDSYKIWPNPAKNKLFFSSGDLESKKVQLYTVQGQKVFQKEYDHSKNMEIDLSGIVPGAYLIHIESSKNTIIEKVLIGSVD